jgi:AraC-like DNA-binding protein
MTAPVPPARHLLRARDFMDVHYAEPLDVDEIARRAHASKAHFIREFRSTFGETPHQYLLTRRIERAQHLLHTTQLSVTEVCLAVGLQSLGSFCTSFKRVVGVTPGEYRRTRQGADLRARVPGCYVRAFSKKTAPPRPR